MAEDLLYFYSSLGLTVQQKGSSGQTTRLGWETSGCNAGEALLKSEPLVAQRQKQSACISVRTLENFPSSPFVFLAVPVREHLSLKLTANLIFL